MRIILKFCVCCYCLLSLTSGTAVGAGEPSQEKLLQQGERMYRQGVLPSGDSMKAYVANDVPVDGKSFTCVSCHLRSGLGSSEGEVVTTPTNGRLLYQERKPYISGSEFVPSISNYAKNLPERPAYSDASLAKLITTGIDPTGRSVLHVMPRYDLEDKDLAVLTTYLKSLSDKPSPGVDNGVIKFATVIVDGSDPTAVESMLTPLQFSINRKNSLAIAAQKNSRVARMGYNMLGDLHSMKFSLARWTLKGEPSTWRAQLEDYYRKEPVFALLGGISPGEWGPVHRFCEDNRIPNLFPVVEYPQVSDTDWYTLYFSRGPRQEGEAAARYLNSMAQLLDGRTIVQVSRDTMKGRTLAAGFREAWSNSGNIPAKEIVLKQGDILGSDRIAQINKELRPAVVIVWDDMQSLPVLEGLAAIADGPKMILSSGTYLGKAYSSTSDSLRDKLYLTYPYRLPHEDTRFDPSVHKILVGKNISMLDPNIVRQSYITAEVLGKALMEMRGELYRDFLLDTIGMMKDMYYPLFERVSFGPGQRFASKGCYIVQIGKGAAPKLIKRTEWVIP